MTRCFLPRRCKHRATYLLCCVVRASSRCALVATHQAHAITALSHTLRMRPVLLPAPRSVVCCSAYLPPLPPHNAASAHSPHYRGHVARDSPLLSPLHAASYCVHRRALRISPARAPRSCLALKLLVERRAIGLQRGALLRGLALRAATSCLSRYKSPLRCTYVCAAAALPLAPARKTSLTAPPRTRDA